MESEINFRILETIESCKSIHALGQEEENHISIKELLVLEKIYGQRLEKVAEEAWLICPNWTEVRRFTKNKNNKDKFFEYMFIDSGIVVGSIGEAPPLMKTRKEIKIEEARKEYQKLITAGWQLTEPKW